MRRLTSLFALLVCLAATGCGVPAEDHARTADLRTRPATPPFPRPTFMTGPAIHTLYLVRGDKLVAVNRRFPVELTAQGTLDELLAGPSVRERTAGLTSALLGSNAVTSLEVREHTAYLELAAIDLEGVGRIDDMLAFAQLVCTLASRPGITHVAFTRDGLPIRVPRADLSLTDKPLTPADYSILQNG